MTDEQLTQILEGIGHLGSLITGLYVLIAVVGVYLAWSLHRLARNQVDSAKLLQQATARLEQDLAEQGE